MKKVCLEVNTPSYVSTFISIKLGREKSFQMSKFVQWIAKNDAK